MSNLISLGLRSKDAAALLGISQSTLWRWSKNGLLHPIRIGQRVTVWKRSELEELLNSSNTDEQKVCQNLS